MTNGEYFFINGIAIFRQTFGPNPKTQASDIHMLATMYQPHPADQAKK